MKNIFLFLILFPFLSCTQNKNDYNCIDRKINEIFKGDYNGEKFVYFDSIRKIEKNLIADKYLVSENYEGYSKFINEHVNLIDEEKSLFFQNLKSYSDFFYHLNSSTMPFLVLTECCECEESDYKKKIQIYDSMKLDGGYPSKENLLKLLKVTNFKCEEEKLILLNFVYLHFMSIVDGKVLENENSPEINFGDD